MRTGGLEAPEPPWRPVARAGAARAARRCRSTKRRPSTMKPQRRAASRISKAARQSITFSISQLSPSASILLPHAAPVEAPFIAHSRDEAELPQIVVDQTASAEANREINKGEHKHKQVQDPADHCRRCQHEHQPGHQQQGSTYTLGETMRGWIILDQAWLQQTARYEHMPIEQGKRTNRRPESTPGQEQPGDQHER